MSSPAERSPREELLSIAASLRAYLEWQVDCGSSGIPRRPKAATATAAPAAPIPEQKKPAPVQIPPVPSSLLRDPHPPSSLPDLPPESIGTREARAAEAPEPPVSLPPITLTEEALTPSARSKRGSIPSAPPPPSTVIPRPLPVLQSDVKGCTQCALHETRTNTVFSRGNIESKLCFVGEAPGADEDAQGLPFVGRAGQLLDRMIQAMGLDPATDVYVCNIIKCRPPGNRRPEPDEVAKCIPYLHEQLAHADPKVIVALGNTAVAALLNTKLGITKVRGTWKLYRGKTLVMPTYHPSYLLRPGPAQSEAKRQAWEDLQLVMKELGLAPKSTAPRSSKT
jgi:uracil-DNA glycosylase